VAASNSPLMTIVAVPALTAASITMGGAGGLVTIAGPVAGCCGGT
jgi:hypothetical protein